MIKGVGVNICKLIQIYDMLLKLARHTAGIDLISPQILP
jgi:hypothetical protein